MARESCELECGEQGSGMSTNHWPKLQSISLPSPATVKANITLLVHLIHTPTAHQT